MSDEVIKTIKIRLNPTGQQTEEMGKLFEAFRIGINFSVAEIEKRYQAFLKEYKPVPKDMQITAFCPVCHENKELSYKDSKGNFVCRACTMKTFSEYTVRKAIYSVGDRVVESDMKDVVQFEAKTHYSIMYAQAYAMWKSFNTWREKRKREADLIRSELFKLNDDPLLKAARQIEIQAGNIKRNNPELTWRHAKAQAVKAMFQIIQNERDQEKNHKD